MAQVYYQLIIGGKKTIHDVPLRVKDEVIRLLEENGYFELVDPMD